MEFGSRIVPVGPPASRNLEDPKGGKSLLSNGEGFDSSASQRRMKLSLWDTAGQETYKSITRSYFRGASGALLVFDITRRATFESVTTWLHDLRQIAEEGIVVILVGNKRDLATTTTVDEGRGGGEAVGLAKENKRVVTQEEAEEWCKANEVMRYVETSAKSGEGVERAFLEVAEKIYQNIEKGKYDLNDRRSGVKGPGAGDTGAKSGGTVRLGLNDVIGKGSARSSSGGCC